MATIVNFLRKHESNLGEVRMVLYQREDERAYPLFIERLNKQLLQRLTAALREVAFAGAGATREILHDIDLASRNAAMQHGPAAKLLIPGTTEQK